MTEPSNKKKLGRDPFEKKRPPRPRRESGENPDQIPAQNDREAEESSFPQIRRKADAGISAIPLEKTDAPVNCLWFWVDLWAGGLTESCFF
jgi:hypothetical protein